MTEVLDGDALLARAEAALAVALPDALGVELVDPRDPAQGVAFVVAGLAVTPAATLHAAALGAVVELAGYLAVAPTLTAAEHAVTHHVCTQYLRAARAGDRVRVRGHLTRRARTLAFLAVDAEIDGAPDRCVARSQLTKSIVAV